MGGEQLQREGILNEGEKPLARRGDLEVLDFMLAPRP